MPIAAENAKQKKKKQAFVRMLGICESLAPVHFFSSGRGVKDGQTVECATKQFSKTTCVKNVRRAANSAESVIFSQSYCTIDLLIPV